MNICKIFQNFKCKQIKESKENIQIFFFNFYSTLPPLKENPNQSLSVHCKTSESSSEAEMLQSLI